MAITFSLEVKDEQSESGMVRVAILAIKNPVSGERVETRPTWHTSSASPHYGDLNSALWRDWVWAGLSGWGENIASRLGVEKQELLDKWEDYLSKRR